MIRPNNPNGSASEPVCGRLLPEVIPVVGVLDELAATWTVKLAVVPSPASTSVWVPADRPCGIVTVSTTTPLEFTTPVPTTTAWAEWMVAVTVDPGTNPAPEIVIFSPAVTVDPEPKFLPPTFAVTVPVAVTM
jgi:hypothetical protein